MAKVHPYRMLLDPTGELEAILAQHILAENLDFFVLVKPPWGGIGPNSLANLKY